MKKSTRMQWQQMLCTIAIVFLCFGVTYAGDSDAAWKMLHKSSEIEISYRYDECLRPDKGTHREYVWLKIKNLTANTVTVEFDKEMWYNEKCLTCGKPGEEYHYLLTLEPREEIEASCEGNSDRALMIFSKMLNVPAKSILTDFKLNNITIKN